MTAVYQIRFEAIGNTASWSYVTINICLIRQRLLDTCHCGEAIDVPCRVLDDPALPPLFPGPGEESSFGEFSRERE